MSQHKLQGRKPLDLTKYGISYEGISFTPAKNKKMEDRSMLIREGTFDQFIEIVRPFSMKIAFLMTLYKKIILKHKPAVFLTFNELAEELGTDARVLRRYAKTLAEEGLLQFAKLDKCDTSIPDQYVFSMGPKFEKWIWKSNLFEKAKKDHVDNSAPQVDKFEEPENQRVHSGPSEEPKGSIADPQRVHSGPPENVHLGEFIGKSPEKSGLSSSSSSIYLSSAKPENETNVSSGEEKAESIRKSLGPWSKKNQIPPRETDQEHQIKLKWVNETNGAVDFNVWRKAVGL